MLQVRGEAQDVDDAAVVGLAHGLGRQRGHVGFDRGVQRVQHIVEAFQFAQLPPVGALQDVAQTLQHAFQRVGHAQGLARGGAQGDHGDLDRGLVEVHRAAGVGGVDAGGEKTAQ